MREFKESVSGKDAPEDVVDVMPEDDDLAELPPAQPVAQSAPARERDAVS
jgi:hypothetical protein